MLKKIHKPSNFTDSTKQERTERLLAEQKKLLELIASGAGAESCLTSLCNAVPRLSPGVRAGILLADGRHERFHRSIAPDLPPSFGEGLEDAPINDLMIGTCGEAVYRGTQVVCEDIAGDDKWSKEWRELCVAHGILACFSTPIRNPEGQPLGSFMLCFNEPRKPNEWERRLADFGTSIASVALEREHTIRALQESEAKLRADLVGYKTLQDISSRIIEEENVENLYEELINAAAAIMHSEHASIQMFYPERGEKGELRLLAFRGFHPDATKFWEWVSPDSNSSCALALQTRKRVIVPDVEKCDFMAGTEDLAAYLQIGIRAVQTTPLISRNGRILGMISTQWNKPHEPSEHDLDFLDVLARQAADLIERMQGEEALRESEERLQISLETGGLCSWQVDLATNVLISSDTCKANFGILPGNDLTYEQLAGAIYEEDRKRWQTAFTRAIRERTEFEVEYRIHRIDGETAWLHVRGRPFYYKDGTPSRMIGVTQNITKRKQAEARMANDLAAMTQLQAISTRIARTRDMKTLLREILAAAVELTGTTKGNIQFYNPDTDNLRIEVHQGFGRRFIEHFKESGSPVVCDVAAHKMERIIWSDIANDPALRGTEDLEVILEDGIRAIQSTPLLTRDGRLLGLLNNHYTVPRRPSDREVRYLDLLARLAADLIERKQAEQALRESEERLRFTLEAVGIGTWEWDITNNTIVWSRNLEALHGMNPGEFDGRFESFLHAIHPDDRGRIQETIRHSIEEDAPYDIEHRWVRRDGRVIWMEGKGQVVRDEQGRAVRMTGICMNVTERKQAEKALRTSEDRLQVTLEAAEMGTWDWDMAAGKTVCNKQFFDLLGLEPDHDGRVKDFFRFMHPEDIDSVSKQLQTAIEETGVLHTEFRIIRVDNGEVRWMSSYGRVVVREGNRAVRFTGVMFDVTVRRALEQQKDEFISVASHELKTPVTSIKAYVELLLETAEQTRGNGSTEFIRRLNLQINRLTDLIHDLLDNARISEKRLPLHQTRFDLNELITENAENFRHTSPKHRLIFRLGDINPVTADRDRIGQVLNNLISNAIKYSPAGGEVTITSIPLKEGVKVSVCDTGIGIPKDVQYQVFDRFFRVNHPQMRASPGMGLGLYIAAGIIERHGGNISVKSEPGKGSTFSFILPWDCEE